MTDLDLDSIRRRHDEDHEHDGGCDLLDLLAEVERLRAAATHEVAAHETQVARLTTRIEKAEAEALRWKAAYEMAEPVLSERDRLQAAVDAVRALATEDRNISPGYHGAHHDNYRAVKSTRTHAQAIDWIEGES